MLSKFDLVLMFSACFGNFRPPSPVNRIFQRRNQGLPGWQAAHPEDRNEGENEEKLRKNERKHRKMGERLHILILPIRESDRRATVLVSTLLAM